MQNSVLSQAKLAFSRVGGQPQVSKVTENKAGMRLSNEIKITGISIRGLPPDMNCVYYINAHSIDCKLDETKLVCKLYR